MMKNLSVAAILLAITLANASELNSNNNVDPEIMQFDKRSLKTTDTTAGVTTEKKRKEVSSSSSGSDSDSSSGSSSGSSSSSNSSNSDSDSDSSSGSDSSSSSSSSSSSDTDISKSDKKTDKKAEKKKEAIKAFKSSHGKKWLKDHKDHEISIARYKSKTDSKGNKHKHSKKSKYAGVKNALKLKSKKPVMITVNDNEIEKGLSIKDNGELVFKTPKTSYAIVEKGSHKISVAANKKGKKGTATIKVQEVKLSKKIAKKYKIIANAVQYKDASQLCESFDGTLAEVREKDIEKIVKAALKMSKNKFKSLWIDRVVMKDDKNTYLPTVLDLEKSMAVDDPEDQYSYIAKISEKEIGAITVDKENKKKYKKALLKAEAKIRKLTDKALDKKDKSTPRPVLCRFD